jgi:hypothetical protein
MDNIAHLTQSELEASLEHITQSPPDNGRVECIVIRPQSNERVALQNCEVSPTLGVHGDNWPARVTSLSLPDGSANPKAQIALMNSRVIAALAQSKERWPLAGDNLFVDLDLGVENISPGQQLAVGSAILEITDIPHTGCGKFAERYGADAARFVNSKTGKQLRLRGIYAQVVQSGVIKVGDTIKKI